MTKERHTNELMQATKQSAIEIQNQEQVIKLIGDGLFINGCPTGYEPQKDCFYPLPEGWGVEIKELLICRQCGSENCTACGVSPLWQRNGLFKRKRAYLTPLPSKEERKALLIEMMKSDEESGMYDSSWDDTMTVAAGTPPDEQEIKIAELQSRIAELEKEKSIAIQTCAILREQRNEFSDKVKELEKKILAYEVYNSNNGYAVL